MPESILKASCTSARHAGSFDCLMARLILITVDNGRGHCAWWQSCTVPNQTHRGNNKKRKMYAIKQIKICAEYRDMIPRPRLDLSGTPGLRPIGLSPGSWQTSLGLGSMSRYSVQILICITMHCVQCTLEKQCTAHHVIKIAYQQYYPIIKRLDGPTTANTLCLKDGTLAVIVTLSQWVYFFNLCRKCTNYREEVVAVSTYTFEYIERYRNPHL